MKRTSQKLVILLLTVAACLPAVDGWAAPKPPTKNIATPSTRDALDQLLIEARAAMNTGELEKADTLLKAAETSRVRYPRLHFGDTPSRARKDWVQLLDAKNRAGRPRFNPLQVLNREKKPTTEDPFLNGSYTGDVGTELGGVMPSTVGQMVADGPNSAAPTRMAIPASHDLANLLSNDTPPSGASQAQPSAREQSGQLLAQARRALSVGDVAQARQALNGASRFAVAYQPSEDSPERVAASIEEAQRLADMQRNGSSPQEWRQFYSEFLVDQAEALVGWGDLETAQRAATEAAQLNPRYASNRTSPADVLQQIQQVRQSQTDPSQTETTQSAAVAGGSPASGVQLAAATVDPNGRHVTQAAASLSFADVAGDYDDDDIEPTLRLARTPRSLSASEDDVLPLPQPADEDPQLLIEQGEELLRNGKRAAALELFQEAYQQKDRLDLLAQQKLQGHLQMLTVAPAASRELPGRSTPSQGSLLSSANSGQELLARQVWADVVKKQSEANKIRESEPMRSQELLTAARTLVQESGLDSSAQQRMLTSVNTSLEKTQQYIRDHKAELDLEAANQSVLDENERRRKTKVEVSERIALLVDQFNKLTDERRDAEAEVVANQLHELAPDELVSQQIWRQAKLIRRERLNQDIIARSEEGVASTFLGVRNSAAEAAINADKDINYGQNWPERVAGRTGSSDSRSRLSPRELDIQRKLNSDIGVDYNERPLSAVVEDLAEITGINIYLDPLGLGQEGVRSDTPISLSLQGQISLKSTLQLILEPLHLTYTVKDEVLKITSEQIRDGEVYNRVYNVADLVIQIPNFSANSQMGLQNMVNEAVNAQVYNGSGGGNGPMALVNSDPRGGVGGALGQNQLGNQFGGAGSGVPVSSGSGTAPGGGAANADFDSLIDLIVSTVEHDSWMENGTGQGEIQPFPTNLSLVVSQTERVHEQIVDLLEQLRRLADLQVTIEVRFIRLTDSFFERIGMDFDLNIENAGTALQESQLEDDGSFAPGQSSTVVGVNAATQSNAPLFNVALDTQFRQDSFTLSTPQFGQPSDLATFGFSILSDIEAYFFVTAAQGDRRANTLNAPKVTLFNGQLATVFDTAFVPFVTSVIPVVGEFAAAQQPVIVVLSEGTMMTVQAVVSDDRRYVRLTLVPFFSQIGEVREFTFDGSETTSNASMSTDDDDDGNDESNDNATTTVRSGTTVQLPTFQVISVSTTVSVPDGGTVLLGGIKRLREGRNEFGVPLLSKIPYLDRLFRNVGIGRETDSLMMMVTPHIIIPEEEEERLGNSN